MRQAIVALFLLGGGAAGGAEGGKTWLEAAVEHARYAEPCAERLPLEHAQSFPVPVRTKGGSRYRVFFYPAVSDEGPAGPDPKAYPPSAILEFDGRGGGVSCDVAVAFPAAEYGKALGPQRSKAARALSAEDRDSKESRLLALTEKAGETFNADKKDAPARETIRAWLTLFELLSEPGMKAYYRALSPEFWGWADSLTQRR